MNPMDYPDYEPTYADLGIDPNNPNEYYYSSDDDNSGPTRSATGSDYAETEAYTDYLGSEYSEDEPFKMSSQVCAPFADLRTFDRQLRLGVALSARLQHEEQHPG